MPKNYEKYLQGFPTAVFGSPGLNFHLSLSPHYESQTFAARRRDRGGRGEGGEGAGFQGGRNSGIKILNACFYNFFLRSTIPLKHQYSLLPGLMFPMKYTDIHKTAESFIQSNQSENSYLIVSIILFMTKSIFT